MNDLYRPWYTGRAATPPEYKRAVAATLRLRDTRNRMARENSELKENIIQLEYFRDLQERMWNNTIAELTALRADKARLDWMQKKGAYISCYHRNQNVETWVVESLDPSIEVQSTSARAAIDVAMKEGSS